MAEMKSHPSTFGAQLEQVVRDIKHLQEKVEKLQMSKRQDLSQQAQNVVPSNFKCRELKRLVGHFGKIYAMTWAQHNDTLMATAAQDGQIIIWDAMTGCKTNAVVLTSQWVMGCQYSPNGRFVAAGGLDNNLTLYPVQDRAPLDPNEFKRPNNLTVLDSHEGYVSACRFFDNNTLYTASGDASLAQWDLTTHTVSRRFVGHLEDVMCLSLVDGNVFLSGSVDHTAKLWDSRLPKDGTVMTFYGHLGDVNGIDNVAQGCFVTCSEDSTCKLWDIRSLSQMNHYGLSEENLSEVNDVAFTNSGKSFLAGYDDGGLICWDTILGRHVWSNNQAHAGRITAVKLCTDGQCFATASWDTEIKIWA